MKLRWNAVKIFFVFRCSKKIKERGKNVNNKKGSEIRIRILWIRLVGAKTSEI